MEVWKDINGFEGYYQISNLGNVKSLDRKVKHSSGGYSNKKGKYLISSFDKNGYKIITLNIENRYKTKKIHRLVAEAFIKNEENKPQVNHKNGIKDDNIVENLEWVTSKENINHSWNNGLCTPKIGQLNPSAKITTLQATDIKYKCKELTVKEISIKYKISQQSISEIRKGKTWTHI